MEKVHKDPKDRAAIEEFKSDPWVLQLIKHAMSTYGTFSIWGSFSNKLRCLAVVESRFTGPLRKLHGGASEEPAWTITAIQGLPVLCGWGELRPKSLLQTPS